MSYSFTVVADNKADATREIREKFDAIVASQPSHAADKEAVVVATQTLVRLLVDPAEGDEIYVNVYGSLSWRPDSPEKFVAASTSINVSIRAKNK